MTASHPRGTPLLEVVAALLVQGGRVLIAKRAEGKSNAGLWEFPGGKVEPGETHAEALAREIWEELGIRVNVGEHLMSTTHAYPFATVQLHAYFCETERGTAGESGTRDVPLPRALEHAEIRFMGPDDGVDLSFAPANVPIVNALCARLRAERAASESDASALSAARTSVWKGEGS